MAFLPPPAYFNRRVGGDGVHLATRAPTRCVFPDSRRRARPQRLIDQVRSLRASLAEAQNARDRARELPVTQHGRTSRRMMLRALGAFCALSAAAHMGATELDDAANKLRAARKQLDDADALIDTARWDSVRTLLVSPPMRDAQDAVRRGVAGALPDVRGAWVGLREDSLSAAKLLDAAVYTNVFIGEDRKVLGTPVDYDTPRIYLQQLKEAYDELVALSEGS